MTHPVSVIDWLLDSDPSIRWQVMRDLIDAPKERWAEERAKVETQGWGARLLSHQDEDGQWAGGAFLPREFDHREWNDVGQPWTATCFSLTQMREFGLDPSSERAKRTVALIGANARWEEGGQPYWQGEVEECINGRTVADGAY
ncbi:squalene cyclase, partial [Corallococcus exiguus]|nr:squalene cyclase [Corallococcus exiguus]